MTHLFAALRALDSARTVASDALALLALILLPGARCDSLDAADECTCEHEADPDAPQRQWHVLCDDALHGIALDAARWARNGDDPDEAAAWVMADVQLYAAAMALEEDVA